ncbi:MAG: sugar transferase [Bacilli bacterium]
MKRLLDVLISGIAIILLLPAWIIISVAIKIDNPGPIIFRQKRIGRDKNGNKQYFNICKFRSMKVSAPSSVPTHLLKNPSHHITRMGLFLRKTSLDELPQIFNIFLGQMSIIGPRPALWNQDDLYDERAKYKANAVRPGLTGLAQINGRDELNIYKKAELDGDYAKQITFRMDLKCFVKTFAIVFKKVGIVEGKVDK